MSRIGFELRLGDHKDSETREIKMSPDQVKYSVRNIYFALQNPERYCCSGRCKHTNWAGPDRVHDRLEECPPFLQKELEGYLNKVPNWKDLV